MSGGVFLNEAEVQAESLEEPQRPFVYPLPRPLYLRMHNAAAGLQTRVDGLFRMRWKEQWRRRLLRAAISRLVSDKEVESGIRSLKRANPPSLLPNGSR